MFADNDDLDEGSVNVSFFSDVGGTSAVGAVLTTGVLDATASDGTNMPAFWEARTLAGAVPTSARSLQIEIANNRVNGSAGNVHFDDFSGAITGVPEPSSMVVIGLASLSVLVRRRKLA